MFLLLFCVLSTAQAQDVSSDYVELSAGETAPYSGRLFTSIALAKMLAQHQTEISLLKTDLEYDLKKQELNLNLKYELLDSKYNAEIEMYQTMIAARDLELRKSAKKDVWQKWATYGGFVLGAATSVAIFYSVDTN